MRDLQKSYNSFGVLQFTTCESAFWSCNVWKLIKDTNNRHTHPRAQRYICPLREKGTRTTAQKLGNKILTVQLEPNYGISLCELFPFLYFRLMWTHQALQSLVFCSFVCEQQKSTTIGPNNFNSLKL